MNIEAPMLIFLRAMKMICFSQ